MFKKYDEFNLNLFFRPIGDGIIKVEDVAATVAFLASHEGKLFKTFCRSTKFEIN
jgi:hypothetical protein